MDKKIIEVEYLNKTYSVNIESFNRVLKHLVEEPAEISNLSELKAMLEKYHLYDEIFLANINLF